MARRKFEKTFNTFVGGLNTEASELNFPENTSLYDKNFLLRTDGGRDRRKGMGVMGPMGLALTSALYPIEAEDTMSISVKAPTVRRRIAAYYSPPESMSVSVLKPVMSRRDAVSYWEYDRWPPESMWVSTLEPSLSRETVVRYLVYDKYPPESMNVSVKAPEVSIIVSAAYLVYDTGDPEHLSVTPLAPTVTRT